MTTVPPEAFGDAPVGLVTAVGAVPGLSSQGQQTVFRVTPVISAFSPAAGYAGETLTITGTGLPSRVQFVGASSATTAHGSGAQITAVVPRDAKTGKLKVTVFRQDVSSPTDFTVLAAPPRPSLSGVSPSEGPAGTVVNISGTNLGSVTGVSWGAGVVSPVSPGFEASRVMTTVPPEAFGDAPVGLVTAVGAVPGLSSQGQQTVFRVTPVISAFSPAAGYAGETLTITGTGLPSRVQFAGASSATTAHGSGAQITAVVPRDAKTGKLKVTAFRQDVSSPTDFTVLAAPPRPSLSGVSPSEGPAGTVVNISGTNLGSVTGVSWGAGVVSPVSPGFEASRVMTTVPPEAFGDAPVGLVTAVGAVPGLSSQGQQTVFRVTPVISAFSPAAGYAGETLTITGTGLPSRVQFAGASSATTAHGSGAQITAVVPRDAKTGKLKVTVFRQDVSSPTDFVIARPITPPSPPATPTLSGVAPASGAAGALLTVSGTNVDSVTGVQIAGVAAPFVVVSKTELDVTVPPDAPAGQDRLVVSTVGGAVSRAFVAVTVAPTLTGVSPPSGYAGETVTVTGTGLAGAVDVNFGGQRAQVLDRTGTSVTVQVPAGPAGSERVELGETGQTVSTNPSGHTVFFNVLTAPATPTLSGVAPASGAAGALLTVSGTNVDSVTGVQIAGVAAPFVVVSKTELDVTVPPDVPAGQDRLVVSTVGGAVSRAFVAVTVAPTLTGVSPPSGYAGETVTVTGTGLVGAVDVNFGGQRAQVLDRTGTSVTVQVPAGPAGSERVELGETGQTVSTNPSGHTVFFNVLTAPATPTLSGVAPASGAAGALLTVSGTNVDSVTGVQIAGVAAPFVVVSKTELDVTVPPDAPAGQDRLVVSTVGGAVSRRSWR